MIICTLSPSYATVPGQKQSGPKNLIDALY